MRETELGKANILFYFIGNTKKSFIELCELDSFLWGFTVYLLYFTEYVYVVGLYR